MIRRKIFYTPGLISLLGLAAILLYYLNTRYVFDRFNVLMVNWDYFDPLKRPEHRKHFLESLNSNTYINIVLDSNVENNVTKLRFSQLTIKEILAKDEVNYGIHFHLADEMPYETFVRVMEIYMIEESAAFYGKDNDIWVFNYKPLPESEEIKNGEIISLRPPTFFCGTGLYMDSMEQDREAYVFPEMKAKFILPLVLLMILGFFSWKKMRAILSPTALQR